MEAFASRGERVWLAVALEQLRSTTEHLRAVERDIAQRVRHCRPVRQLLSIVGFHIVAAATYYAYVGDPGALPRASTSSAARGSHRG
ncbi:hypothetical protein [Geochorda subterranea]|uniref:Uncharacterized protein n=1 Tax=Geochorda subterranea TaxID=3109564 RepID=A0ABZ1BQZ1_9FIRM|nr:hypothetical protein [Limnochorda sp. LNt]WRP15234.1 hypothetical protein VLY81_03435 [Limnochorda sp. LNt]